MFKNTYLLLVEALKTAIKNTMEDAPKLLDMAEVILSSVAKLIRKATHKQTAVSAISSSLDNADVADAHEAHKRDSVAGFMVLPLLLGDNENLLYKEYETRSEQST